jgi:serine phosphatase RsbU (regulator of sigma subunit)/ketosteroid isomerase-like protein
MDVVAQPLSKNATWQKDKKEEATVSSEAEQNKTLVRRLFEARGKLDMDAMDKMLAPHFLSHTKVFPGQQLDREGFKRMTLEYAAAFSNTRFIVEEQVAEAEKVVSRFTVHATHDLGEFLGVAPTGREVTSMAIFIHRISDGKIAEERSLGTVGQALMEQRLEQERVERERIEQELEVARSIQQASLPEEVPTPEGWQISPYYQPAREVGGDFYDFFELPDGRLGLVVGDATGKGVPAALVMASARSMLRAVAGASEYSPGDVLGRVNDALATDIPANMFITCFYAILDPESGRLIYANAGHDLPYVWQNGEAEELRARGMPLGLMPGMSYEQKEIVLEGGDSALFYSDGLVEAHDPQRDMFGFLRLRTLVREHGKQESLEEALLEQLYSFVGEGWEQEDDITLLTLRRFASLS